MALSFYNNTNDTLIFDEFIKIINNKIKSFYDIEGLLECQTDLHNLSKNKTFFIDFINHELINNLDSFQKGNNYTYQSYIIFRNKKFYIRVNWWPILEKENKYYDELIDSFSYDIVHDHNFPLLTVGYKGAYTTKLWEYNYEEIIGYEGEKVKMNFLEETDLDVGKVMYYRPSKDIHKQLMPKNEFSISLNIILDSPLKNKQYSFDERNSTIKSLLYAPMGQYHSLFKFVEQFQNEETKNILESLVNNENPFVRLEAIKSLSKITQTDVYWQKAERDKERFVAEIAKMRIY